MECDLAIYDIAIHERSIVEHLAARLEEEVLEHIGLRLGRGPHVFGHLLRARFDTLTAQALLDEMERALMRNVGIHHGCDERECGRATKHEALFHDEYAIAFGSRTDTGGRTRRATTNDDRVVPAIQGRL